MERSRRLWPWLLAMAVAAVFVWMAVSVADRWGPPEPVDPPTEVLTPDQAPPASAPP